MSPFEAKAAQASGEPLAFAGQIAGHGAGPADAVMSQTQQAIHTGLGRFLRTHSSSRLQEGLRTGGDELWDRANQIHDGPSGLCRLYS